MTAFSKGELHLVPTPLDDETTLEESSCQKLRQAFDRGDVICVEDPKPGRRRWLKWGLPREAIDHFFHYNEHSRQEQLPQLIDLLKKGKNVYLLSDEGLPAFCDPGRELVEACHREGIRVTAFPFANSVVLALALSGFSHDEFLFLGFPPKRAEERTSFFKGLREERRTMILMDTPYRLKRVLQELDSAIPSREVCLACELGSSQELTLRGSPADLIKRLGESKLEFVAVISPL